MFHDRKNFSKHIVFNFRPCYVLKKTSKVSMLMAMHCTMHDIFCDSESIVFFHKRKEDLWNSEVWCSPFAPALWLWLSVSVFLPLRFTSNPFLPASCRAARVHWRELFWSSRFFLWLFTFYFPPPEQQMPESRHRPFVTFSLSRVPPPPVCSRHALLSLDLYGGHFI